MPDQNENQDPVTLQELLYVKSLPVLSKILSPVIDGSAVANYRITNVKIVNGDTVVVIEQTKDPRMAIADAQETDIVTREIDYKRHHISAVFSHFLGGLGPFAVHEMPADAAGFSAWLATKTDRLVIDADLQLSIYGTTVTVQPKSQLDLRWKGVAHLNFVVNENIAAIEPPMELYFTYNNEPVMSETLELAFPDGETDGLFDYGFGTAPITVIVES